MVSKFGKSIVIITGASRGIGKEIAFQAAALVESGSVFILTARNQQLLTEVREEIHKINGVHTVETFSSDMEHFNRADELRKLQDAVGRHCHSPFDTLLLFHNAGTTGDVSKPAAKLSDVNDWNAYWAINFTSMVLINNEVLDLLCHTDIKKKLIVNITSLVAIKGFPSLCQYSVGKSARESFFRVLAAEQPSLRILSYSPGPVDTDMHDTIAKESFDDEIRSAFSKNTTSQSAVNRSTLTPTETVSKMMKYLQEDKYVSGDRIDYFDLTSINK